VTSIVSIGFFVELNLGFVAEGQQSFLSLCRDENMGNSGPTSATRCHPNVAGRA
jgi:hypothetical protein